MTTITLESIEARQKELGDLIAKFKAQPTSVTLPSAPIQLQPGERYAGVVLDEQGQFKHHLILLPQRPSKRLPWQDAMDWAEGIGGALPDRQEQALLFANCKPHLEAAWHWSCQQHDEDASSAWGCDFSNGSQSTSRKSSEGSAVAVRRLNP